MYDNLLQLCEEIIFLNQNLYLGSSNFYIPKFKYKKYVISIQHTKKETSFIFMNYKIKNHKLGYISFQDDVDFCCVCFENTNTETKCCRKKICFDCVKNWKRTRGYRTYTCPHCRQEINKSNIKTQYLNVNISLDEIKRKKIIENQEIILKRIKKQKINLCC
jgi:hypothetical protein